MKVICTIKANKGSDVELAWVPGTLRVSNFFMVHPHGKTRVDPLKSQPQLMVPVPVIKVETCHVAAALVIINRNMRWVNGEGVVVIEVLGPFTVPLKLPHARDGDLLWTPFLGRRQLSGRVLIKVDGPIEGVLGDMEQPFA